MKIYDSNMGGVPASGTQRTQETQQADRANSGAKIGSGGADDRVEFSGTLGQLSRAVSAFQSDRSSRVQALAAQYQSGTYRTNSAATAGAMISEALGGGAEAGLR
jgi:anti-sigma28 factor (negative regulator of flagellin synthesis)